MKEKCSLKKIDKFSFRWKNIKKLHAHRLTCWRRLSKLSIFRNMLIAQVKRRLSWMRKELIFNCVQQAVSAELGNFLPYHIFQPQGSLASPLTASYALMGDCWLNQSALAIINNLSRGLGKRSAAYIKKLIHCCLLTLNFFSFFSQSMPKKRFFVCAAHFEAWLFCLLLTSLNVCAKWFCCFHPLKSALRWPCTRLERIREKSERLFDIFIIAFLLAPRKKAPSGDELWKLCAKWEANKIKPNLICAKNK